jgi:hypothetical protein
VEGELSPEEAERYLERLERELSGGDRDWAVRIHVHRAGNRFHCAFAVTRGGGRYGEVTTASCEGLGQLESLFRQYAERIWSTLLAE